MWRTSAPAHVNGDEQLSSRDRRFALPQCPRTLTIGAWLIFAFSTSGCNKEAPPAPAAAPAPAPTKGPLRIAFSDWPGWTAFQVGIEKGWFKDAGVDVKFDSFEYAPSMEAFAAGKVDAVMMTMGDALVTGAPGPRSLAILVTVRLIRVERGGLVTAGQVVMALEPAA